MTHDSFSRSQPDVTGTPEDPTLSVSVRQALDMVWGENGEIHAARPSWNVDVMRETFASRRRNDVKGRSERSSVDRRMVFWGKRSLQWGMRATREIPVRKTSRWSARFPMMATVVLGAIMMVVARVRFGSHAPSGTADRLYKTSAGQTAQITLIDGSHVILAPQSRLTVVGGFGVTTRTVALVGEAYFDIPHSSGAPFRVQTGRVTTRVLGTTFDVRYYRADAQVRVAVLHGRVTVGNAHTSALFAAGTIGHITDSTAMTVKGDVGSLADWRFGRLIFEDTPVSTVLASVGRWYGYDFTITDSALAQRRIMAAFHVNEPEKTLAAIKHLLNVTMTFNGSTVTVRPNQLQSEAPSRRDTARFSSTPAEAGK